MPLAGVLIGLLPGCTDDPPPEQGADAGVEHDAGPDATVDDECQGIRCPPSTVCAHGACVSRDPCLSVVCDDGFVCSVGSCVNELVDQDGDGYPASSDCDDTDLNVKPGTTAECSTACGTGTTTCTGNRWGPCSAPSDCLCTRGETRNEPCGRCGTATRTCDENGEWSADVSACGNEGECSPDATEVGACAGGGGPCERRSRTCTIECVWGDWGLCEGQDECVPLDRETRACGDCGEQERTCTDQCLWGSYGSCNDEGQCTPDDTDSRGCGGCGTETRTCGGSCSWGAWSGCAAGSCTPGDTDTEACGACGTRTRTCGVDCNWGTWSGCAGEGSCAAGDSESRGCGDCGTQTRTCSAQCTWSAYGVCGGEGECTPGATRACVSAPDETCTAVCQWEGCGGCTCDGFEGPIAAGDRGLFDSGCDPGDCRDCLCTQTCQRSSCEDCLPCP